jgi:hypothetical protein
MTYLLQEEIEDIKGAIRIRISKKNTMAKRKNTKGQLSTKHTHKTKDRVGILFAQYHSFKFSL